MLKIFLSLLIIFPVLMGFGEIFQKLFGRIWSGFSAKLFSGVEMLDDVRDIMFEKSKYDKILISDIVTMPLEIASVTDNMETVMDKFKETDQWNMPVTDNGKYIGFVSKSKIFDAYRNMLIEFSEE